MFYIFAKKYMYIMKYITDIIFGRMTFGKMGLWHSLLVVYLHLQILFMQVFRWFKTLNLEHIHVYKTICTQLKVQNYGYFTTNCITAAHLGRYWDRPEIHRFYTAETKSYQTFSNVFSQYSCVKTCLPAFLKFWKRTS